MKLNKMAKKNSFDFYTIIMNIQSIKNTSPVFFRGYTRTTDGIKGQNKMAFCISEGHFMRDLESVSFAVNYAKENFPQGTNIAVEGCSQNEAYTWATLLHSLNNEKRYKITGYDIIPEVIEDAKLGVLNIGVERDTKGRCRKNNYERFLTDDYLSLTPQQRAAKTAFQECFEKVPDNWKNFNVYDKRYKHKATKRLVQPNQDAGLTIKRLEYIHFPNNRSTSEGIDFIPKEGIFKDVLDYKVSDIMNIDKELTQEKPGIVVFKNSLYHLLGSRIKESCAEQEYEQIDINLAKILFKKIYSVLPKNGLFVLGTLSHDHFYNRFTMENMCTQIYQDGKQINVFDSSPIHEALRASGFEPIFYERLKINGAISNDILTHLPSIWRKVRHV